MRHAQFTIEAQSVAAMLILDIGPWDQFPTVTNDAEHVVKALAANGLGDRRLFYVDTQGDVDEIVHDGPMFIGFRPARKADIMGLFTAPQAAAAYADAANRPGNMPRFECGGITIVNIDTGDGVRCDLCGKEFTNSNASGGIYGLGTKAIGPCCSAKVTVDCEKYGEQRYILAHCPADMSFADWVRKVIRVSPPRQYQRSGSP